MNFNPINRTHYLDSHKIKALDNAELKRNKAGFELDTTPRTWSILTREAEGFSSEQLHNGLVRAIKKALQAHDVLIELYGLPVVPVRLQSITGQDTELTFYVYLAPYFGEEKRYLILNAYENTDLTRRL